MAVNQTQVDDIINAASEQDPAVRLQGLEREVDLLKISIKHILMDIRERMNEMENPFVIVSSAKSNKTSENPEVQSQESALDARKAALDAQESELELKKIQVVPEPPIEKNISKYDVDPALVVQDYPVSSAPAGLPARSLPHQEPPHDPLPLQKAYNLFSWTRHGVKKFGSSRLEILVETYCVMGYIKGRTADEIRQISHLMPLNLGEEQEIGPDEFVTEIYSLNRILAPHDTSLDRDMIEVIMSQRRQNQYTPAGVLQPDAVPTSAQKTEPQEAFGFGTIDQRWMNLRA